VEYYRPYGVEDYQTEHYRGAMRIAGAARKMRRFRGLGRVGAKIGGRVGSAGAMSAAMARRFRGAGKVGASLARRGRSGGKKMSAAAKKLRKMRKARAAAAKARKAKQAARLRKMQKLKKMKKMQKAKRAKKAKEAAEKAKAAKKAAKAADKAEDAADASSRLSRAAKLAKKGGSKVKKFAGKHKRFLKYAALAGAIGGGTMFLDKKYKERDKRVKECASVCLPKNWDAFDQKKIKSTELQFKTLEEVKAAGAVPDQPVCTKDMGQGKCESHCIEGCEKITELDLGPVGNVAKKAVGSAVNVAGKAAKAGLNVAGKTAKAVLGPIWKAVKKPFMIIFILIILSVVLKFMPKGRLRAPPPAVY